MTGNIEILVNLETGWGRNITLNVLVACRVRKFHVIMSGPGQNECKREMFLNKQRRVGSEEMKKKNFHHFRNIHASTSHCSG